MALLSNHRSKVKVTYLGIKNTYEKGFKIVFVEGDSLNIVNFLQGISKPSWTIEDIIFESRAIINSFDQIYISYIYREGNSLTNYLANVGVILMSVKLWEGYELVLEMALSLLRHDIQNRS